MNFVPWIHCDGELCENPLWDERNGRVLWTDIPAGKIWSSGLEDTEPTLLYEGALVGGFTIQQDGTLLLFRESDIAVLDRDGKITGSTAFRHAGSSRFNDVMADSTGRVFAGTIGKEPHSGGLFQVDLDGSIQQIADGTGCSNGMGFSLDLKTLYWTCSTRKIIYAFDYNSATGEAGNQRPFILSPAPEDGVPDGLTVDSNGNLLSARWGAAEAGVILYDPQGAEIGRWKQPAKCTTSLCFCGHGLELIAITTAKSEEDRSRTADLFLVRDSGLTGLDGFCSNIQLPGC